MSRPSHPKDPQHRAQPQSASLGDSNENGVGGWVVVRLRLGLPQRRPFWSPPRWFPVSRTGSYELSLPGISHTLLGLSIAKPDATRLFSEKRLEKGTAPPKGSEGLALGAPGGWISRELQWTEVVFWRRSRRGCVSASTDPPIDEAEKHQRHCLGRFVTPPNCYPPQPSFSHDGSVGRRPAPPVTALRIAAVEHALNLRAHALFSAAVGADSGY